VWSQIYFEKVIYVTEGLYCIILRSSLTSLMALKNSTSSSSRNKARTKPIVSEHMGWVRSVVLMNVYSGFGKPRGVGILSRGGDRWPGWGKCKGQFMSNLRERWTGPITARRVPSKWKKGSKGTLCT
jgi:hypothetical protein